MNIDTVTQSANQSVVLYSYRCVICIYFINALFAYTVKSLILIDVQGWIGTDYIESFPFPFLCSVIFHYIFFFLCVSRCSKEAQATKNWLFYLNDLKKLLKKKVYTFDQTAWQCGKLFKPTAFQCIIEKWSMEQNKTKRNWNDSAIHFNYYINIYRPLNGEQNVH